MIEIFNSKKGNFLATASIHGQPPNKLFIDLHILVEMTLLNIVTSILVSFLLCSCSVKVAPWERGNLAKPSMALDPNPTLSTLRQHVFTSKEASQRGYGGEGGGCGCN
ncbi:MAG: DUF4266 domain-containing protein [Methylococcales bacterium]